jgi:hypothetical protein
VEIHFISLQFFIQNITIIHFSFFVIFHLYNFIKLDSCLIYFEIFFDIPPVSIHFEIFYYSYTVCLGSFLDSRG